MNNPSSSFGEDYLDITVIDLIAIQGLDTEASDVVIDHLPWQRKTTENIF